MENSGDEEYVTVERVKLPVKDLKVGMYVCALDRPWLESPFLFQGFEIKSEADIKAVQDVCQYVYVDVQKLNRIEAPKPLRRFFQFPLGKSGSDAKSPRRKKVSVEKEFEKANNAYRETSSLVKTMMDDIRLGNSLDMNKAKEAVSECVQSILRNPDALMLLTMLKNKDEYTSQHSLHVSLYSIALGRHLDLPVNEIERLGLCGMMHDIGKMETPLNVLNKAGRLTPEEMEIMKQHPGHGRNILISTRNVDPQVVDVAFGHHERLGGQGYPRGIDGTGLTPYVKMVAIVDTYDAVSSDRVYQQGRTHMDGISVLTRMRSTGFDSSLVFKFVECLGIYPPGTVVEMSNGEVGIVVEVNPEHKIRPKVLLLFDELKRPRKHRLVDLSKLDLDASGQSYRIKAVLRPDAYGINLREYHEKGLIGNALSG